MQKKDNLKTLFSQTEGSIRFDISQVDIFDNIEYEDKFDQIFWESPISFVLFIYYILNSGCKACHEVYYA